MSLKLKVISGSEKGAVFDLKSGSIIGRGQADIVLNDTKISGQHARVESDKSGNLVLVDLGSTNGLRVKGKRLAQVPLEPNLKIRIGRVEVIVIAQENAVSRAAPQAPLELPPLTWREYFAEFGRKSKGKVKNTPHELKPFRPLLVLRFMRGLQLGTEWTIGYGPRRIGLASLDFHLFEPKAPPIAFTVSPDSQGAQFYTEHSEAVLLNGKRISTDKLSDGDVIEIGDTVIRVGFRL